MIEVTRDPSSALMADWVINGGHWHLQVSSKKMNVYASWADALPFLLEVELEKGKRVAICHAEYPLPHWSPESIMNSAELTRELQWSRKKVHNMDQSFIDGIDHVVCGHTIVNNPLTLGNTHFIDTGAYSSNILTLQKLSDLNVRR